MASLLRRLVPNVVRRSYVAKFGITLLVLGLAVGGIGFLATQQIAGQVQDGVNNDLANVASQEAQSFESWHERNRLVATGFARSERVERNEDVGGYLRNRVEGVSQDDTAPGVARVHHVDVTTGTVVHSTEPGAAGTDVGSLDRPWTAAVEGRTAFTDLSTRTFGGFTDEAGDPLMAYLVPVQATGGFDRAIVYVVNVSSYEGGLRAEPGSATYVVPNRNGTGTVVYDSTGALYPAEDGLETYGELTVLEAASRTAAGGPGVGTEGSDRVGRVLGNTEPLTRSVGSEYEDEEYVVAFATANLSGTDTPYSVLVHTPTSEAYGFVDRIEDQGFVVVVTAVLVIGLVGAVLGRNTATSIDRLRRKTEQMESGNLDVDFDSERVDSIGQLYDGLGNMRDALREQILEAREAREEAELAQERAEQTSRHLQAKAGEYRDVMQACAAGDLSTRMDPSDRNEAMREIAEEFNAMIAELEQTVTQLKEFANEVATSSEEVTASSEEVRSASQQVTESIQEISEGAQRQNDSLQSVSEEMSGLSTTVEEIASLSNEVADLSERTAETGRRGREAAQEAIAGMNQIETDAEDAVEQIDELEREMAQIDELIEFITDVADQTNMLALNANIEAARSESGEAGEGFAVVAEEVKDLAEETKTAAENIEERLERIQTQTDRTVEGVKTTGDRIAEHTASVRNAVEALDEIAGYAQETNTGVQEISAATQEQAASTEEVVAMVDEAATISEQTTDEADNVAAAAEEQTSAMSEVSESASGLSRQATRLSEALDRFTTSEGVDATIDRTPDPDAGESEDAGGDADGRTTGMPGGDHELDAEEIQDGIEDLGEDLGDLDEVGEDDSLGADFDDGDLDEVGEN
jgi:methyl-accepting chemotaxis protein